MLQFAALLGAVLDGLSDQDHPNGNYIYAVRDGDSFIYIGMTGAGVWGRICAHKYARDPLWRAVCDEGPTAARWRVEACHFRTEDRISALEAALIQRHKPRINWAHKPGRRRMGDEPFVSAGAGGSPAYQAVFATGWPSFQGIELETLPDRWRAAPNRPQGRDRAFANAPDALHQYDLLTPVQQDILQFWIVHAVMPAQKLHRRHFSQGLCALFEALGFLVELDAFRGAMLVAGYAPVWNPPPGRDCAYHLRQAMRPGQSVSKWHHQTKLGYIQAFAYTWYWPTNALEHYSTLLDTLGASTQCERDLIQRLLAVKYGQRLDGHGWY